MIGQREFECPRIGRSRPLTLLQLEVFLRVADGERLVDDCFGTRLEPSGVDVPRQTMRALVRAGLIEDPGTPLFNPHAGEVTGHGRTYAKIVKLGETQ